MTAGFGITLSQKWTNVLVRKPEHAMGYQIVDVVLKNGVTVESLVVSNCELLQVPSEYNFSEEDIEDIIVTNKMD